MDLSVSVYTLLKYLLPSFIDFNSVWKLFEFSTRTLIRMLARFISKATRKCTVLQDLSLPGDSKQKCDFKKNRKVISSSVTVMPQPFTMSIKLSHAEIKYFLLSDNQRCKQFNVAVNPNSSEVIVKKQTFVFHFVHFLETPNITPTNTILMRNFTTFV